MISRHLVGALLAVALVGCSDSVFGPRSLPAPTNLTYQVVPSGDPYAPEGVILRWDAPYDGRIAAFVVYSRASTRDHWSRRAETTSSSFHDVGMPHLQYYVASRDDAGEESVASNVVTVAERSVLVPPSTLVSVSLDGAIQLSWSADGRQADPSYFDHYRVYSTTYSLDAGTCAASYWVLEGTTISEDFLVTGIPNGGPRCFAVSTVSRDGFESLWSAPRADTPRFDARNEYLYARESDASRAGFRFYVPATGALGVAYPGDRSDLDFRVERDTDGRLYLVPVRADVTVALYSTEPVEDLTSIDIAPPRSQFARAGIEAVPGYAYVFELRLADGLHYAAVRVTHVTQSYVLFDWAYQSDPGNPELEVQLPVDMGD